MVALTGCERGTILAPETQDEAQPAAVEARTGVVLLETLKGTDQRVWYEEDGEARLSDCVSLGPVEDFLPADGRAVQSSVPTVTMGTPHWWTDGWIPVLFDSEVYDASVRLDDLRVMDFSGTDCEDTYDIPPVDTASDAQYLSDEDMCTDLRSLVLGIGHWEAEVPYIEFLDREDYTSDTGLTDEYLLFTSNGKSNPSYSSPQYDASNNVVKPPRLQLNVAGQTSAVHELGHALGYAHEQNRADREDYIHLDAACVKPGKLGQYQISSSGTHGADTWYRHPYGPFDFASRMLYSSYGSTKEEVGIDLFRAPNSVHVTAGCDVFLSLDPLFGATSRGAVLYQEDVFSGSTWNVDVRFSRMPDLDTSDTEVPVSGEIERSVTQDVYGSTTGGVGVYLSNSRIMNDLGWTGTCAELLNASYWAVRRTDTTDASCPVLVRRDAGGTVLSPVVTHSSASHEAAFVRETTVGTDHFLSHLDISSAWFHWLGADPDGGEGTTGDRLGEALVFGDFDGDAIEDLAVSVPADNGGSGRVIIYRGLIQPHPVDYAASNQSARVTFQAWTSIPFTLGVWALAAGDLNADGKDELVVGYPSFAAEYGNVSIYQGDDPREFTLTETRIWLGSALTQGPNGKADGSWPSDFGETPGARLGYALAIGDFDGNGIDDLAAGLPGEDSPEPPILPDTGLNPDDYVSSGVVALWLGSASDVIDLQHVEQLLTPYDNHGTVRGSKADAGFGSSLVAVTSESVACSGLAVGAPGDHSLAPLSVGYETHGDHQTAATVKRPGQVYLFSAPAMGCGGSVTLFGTPVQTNHASDGAEFGFSLTSGHFVSEPYLDTGLTPNPEEDLAIGAPGDVYDTGDTADDVLASAGQAFVLEAGGAGSLSVIDPVLSMQVLDPAADFGECHAEGNRFGHALAAGRWSYASAMPRDVLAVGSPGKPSGCSTPGEDYGGVFLYEYDGSRLADLELLEQLQSNAQVDDALGSSLAFRELSGVRVSTSGIDTHAAERLKYGQLSLAIGAPGAYWTAPPTAGPGQDGGIVLFVEPTSASGVTTVVTSYIYQEP